MKKAVSNEDSPELAVIIHGGAGSIVDREQAAKETPIMRQALDAAWEQLAAGRPGEEAVVAGLRVLEGCEFFDSGYGSFPNEEGKVRLDVGLMRGNGDFVSVVNIPRMRHPSEFALDILRSNRSIMLAWDAALDKKIELASDQTRERYGVSEDEASMISPYALQYIKSMKNQRSSGGMLASSEASSPMGHDTVGVVVRDARGRIFAGTSTGGTALKPVGRVGDSPIIGAGVFADDQTIGVSATGHGETILKSLVTSFVVAEARRQLEADTNAFEKNPNLLRTIIQDEIAKMSERYPDRSAGLIAIGPRGRPAFAFNSKVLPVAWRVGSASKIEAEQVEVVGKSRAKLVANG